MSEKIDIERQPVASTNVKSVGYHADSKTLAIEFVDGTLYHYADVPQSVYDDILSHKSVGKYVHSAVKGIYKHAKQS